MFHMHVEVASHICIYWTKGQAILSLITHIKLLASIQFIFHMINDNINRPTTYISRPIVLLILIWLHKVVVKVLDRWLSAHVLNNIRQIRAKVSLYIYRDDSMEPIVYVAMWWITECSVTKMMGRGRAHKLQSQHSSGKRVYMKQGGREI